MDFCFLRCLVFPHGFVVRRHFERAAGMAEKIVAIRQSPAVLRMLASMFPLDFAVRRHHADFAGVGISADKLVSGSRRESDGQERQEYATGEK